MSEPEQNQDMVDLDGGKRKFKKASARRKPRASTRKLKGEPIIVGKIYANWCGHCHALKPEWKKMRKILKRKPNGRKYKFVEIEETQMDKKMSQFQEDHNVQLQANGFPSLFRLENGKLDYYAGPRTAHQMAEWYSFRGQNNQGGEPEPEPAQHMPGLMMDMQGGKRHRPRRSNKTFRNCSDKSERKGGLWSFFFGK